MRNRPRASILAIVVGLVFGSGFASPPASVALDGTELLPDLGSLAPKDFSVQSRPRGARWLRFDTVIVNVGPGVFEVEGRGPVVGDELDEVVQLVETVGGGRTEVATPATMFFAGDGHDHWHVRDLQDWTIASVNDRATPLRSGAKTGFCFWDNYRYRSTADPEYHPSTTSACEMRADGRVPMGLSVRWGDEYPSNIAFQYIDISGLPNGDYVVTLEVDLDREFVEVDESNNTAWAVVRLSRKGVTLLSSGTDLQP